MGTIAGLSLRANPNQKQPKTPRQTSQNSQSEPRATVETQLGGHLHVVGAHGVDGFRVRRRRGNLVEQCIDRTELGLKVRLHKGWFERWWPTTTGFRSETLMWSTCIFVDAGAKRSLMEEFGKKKLQQNSS